jgi:hypothetical protein
MDGALGCARWLRPAFDDGTLVVTPLSRIVFFAALTAGATGGTSAHAEPPALPNGQSALRAQIEETIADLDSPFYSVRSEAALQIELWLRRRDTAPLLSKRFEQLNLQPDLPLEVRSRVSLWRARFSRARTELPQTITPSELEQLVRQLDDDSYALRAGATERLRWLAGSENLAGPVLLCLRRRLAEPWISEDCFRRVDFVDNIAWAAWMSHEAPELKAASPSDEQVQKWLDALTRAPAELDQGADLLRRVAHRKLLDALTQDRDVPRLKAAIEARAGGNKYAAEVLATFVDLTKPAIVFESWSGGVQVLEEYCPVGAVAQIPDADRPIIFDRINEEEAHCKGAGSLPRGDYPLGIAFLPANSATAKPAIFFLTNLSTPRRQIAYSYTVKTDPTARLAQLSRQTLDRFAARKRMLDYDDLAILGQLDTAEVSRFAGRFFATMSDGPVEEDFDEMLLSGPRPGELTSQNSCFGAICIQLLKKGTRDAAPGLVAALRQKKFRQPTAGEPYWLAWMAAFVIARRDPWPDLDAFLAENLNNQQTIVLGNDQDNRLQKGTETATVGAMAAAMLARRHGCRPLSLGLVRTFDKQMETFNLYGYRYGKPEDVERVLQWWKAQSAAEAKQM